MPTNRRLPRILPAALTPARRRSAGSASAFLLLTAGVAVLGQRRYRISVAR